MRDRPGTRYAVCRTPTEDVTRIGAGRFKSLAEWAETEQWARDALHTAGWQQNESGEWADVRRKERTGAGSMEIRIEYRIAGEYGRIVSLAVAVEALTPADAQGFGREAVYVCAVDPARIIESANGQHAYVLRSARVEAYGMGVEATCDVSYSSGSLDAVGAAMFADVLARAGMLAEAAVAAARPDAGIEYAHRHPEGGLCGLRYCTRERVEG